MLTYDKKKRMDFDELYKHDWITGKYEVPDPNQLGESVNLQSSVILKNQYVSNQKREEQNQKYPYRNIENNDSPVKQSIKKEPH